MTYGRLWNIPSINSPTNVLIHDPAHNEKSQHQATTKLNCAIMSGLLQVFGGIKPVDKSSSHTIFVETQLVPLLQKIQRELVWRRFSAAKVKNHVAVSSSSLVAKWWGLPPCTRSIIFLTALFLPFLAIRNAKLPSKRLFSPAMNLPKPLGIPTPRPRRR
jgi:hypothetical protein